MPAKFELIAPCFFGCESTAKFELTRIGAENIRVEDGRLSFCGGDRKSTRLNSSHPSSSRMPSSA